MFWKVRVFPGKFARLFPTRKIVSPPSTSPAMTMTHLLTQRIASRVSNFATHTVSQFRSHNFSPRSLSYHGDGELPRSKNLSCNACMQEFFFHGLIYSFYPRTRSKFLKFQKQWVSTSKWSQYNKPNCVSFLPKPFSSISYKVTCCLQDNGWKVWYL